MFSYFRTLREFILTILCLSLFFTTLSLLAYVYGQKTLDGWVYIAYNVLRFLVIYYAGRAIIKTNEGGLFLAALTGPVLLFIDDVILGVMAMAVGQMFAPNTYHMVFEEFSGTILIYLISFPAALLGSFLGGYLYRKKHD